MSRNNDKEKIELAKKPGLFGSRPIILALLLYVAALLVVFSPVLLKPVLSADTISQGYTAFEFNKRYVAVHHTLPFWYPNIVCGMPYLESVVHNYLFDIPLYLIRTDLALTYKFLIFLLLAGIMCYLFFKSLGFSPGIATLAGLVYMLSGDAVTYSILGHFGKPINMAFLPAAFLFLNLGFKHRKLIFFLFTGVVMGFMMQGHPQVFYYNLMVITAYVVFKTIFDYRSNRDKKIFLTALLGYALVAVTVVFIVSDNLFNQLIFNKLTSRGGKVDPVQAWQFATSWSMHPLELLGYLVPSIFGLHGQTYMGWRPFIETADYVGFAVFLTAVFGIVVGWKSRYVKFFTVVAVLAVLFGFGSFFTPYYKIFYKFFPMIKSFRVPSSVYIVVSFLLVYFFAYGLRWLTTADYTLRENRKKVLVFAGAVAAVIIVMAVYINSPLYENTLRTNLGGKMDLRTMYQKYQAAQVDGYIAQIVTQARDLALKDLKTATLLAALFCLLLLLLFSRKFSRPLFLFLLTVLLFFDLRHLDRKFITAIDNYDEVAATTPEIAFLQKDRSKFRILPFPARIDNESNKWGLFHLESAYGYNALAIKEFDDVFRSGFFYNLKLLGLMNVKYLLTAGEVGDPNLKPVFRGNQLVYSNRLVLPREILFSRYRVLKHDQMLGTMLAPAFSPLEEVLLEEEPVFPPAGPPNPTNYVRIMSYENDRIVLRTGTDRPGIVFLSDAFFYKWESKVNGRPSKIYRADYMFRGIPVSPGTSEIVLRYGKNGLYWPMVLIESLFVVLMLILMIREGKKLAASGGWNVTRKDADPAGQDTPVRS